MAKGNNDVCGDCTYFKGSGSIDDHSCRRYPPVTVTKEGYSYAKHISMFPRVDIYSEACGEYKKKEVSDGKR